MHRTNKSPATQYSRQCPRGGGRFLSEESEVLLWLKGVLDKTGASHAFLLAKPALHAEIDCERQFL